MAGRVEVMAAARAKAASTGKVEGSWMSLRSPTTDSEGPLAAHSGLSPASAAAQQSHNPASRSELWSTSMVEEDEDDEEEEDDFGEQYRISHQASKYSSRNFRELQKQASMAKIVEVPDAPAPPVEPASRTLQRIPAELMGMKETVVGRIMNSTMGRASLFALTIFFFVCSAVGLILWQLPYLQLRDEDRALFLATLASILILYSGLPMLAKIAGMAPRPDGFDWKPYLVLYRIGYLTAIPALLFLGMGYGTMIGFGTAEGVRGVVRVSELTPASLHYFEAADGFVALNLTQGIVENLRSEEHGNEGSRRSSRFKDAELRINTEPFSDIPEPTVPPGTLSIYRIAPVFANWETCLTLYEISVNCLRDNPVIGWAIVKSRTVCTALRSLACQELGSVLDPVYHCSSTRIHGEGYTGQISGLCGRIIRPPKEAVIDEFAALLVTHSWPTSSLPNSTHLWLDVREDSCIENPDVCLRRWGALGVAGIFFTVVTVACIAMPAFMDWSIDRRIREAQQFLQESRKSRQALAFRI